MNWVAQPVSAQTPTSVVFQSATVKGSIATVNFTGPVSCPANCLGFSVIDTTTNQSLALQYFPNASGQTTVGLVLINPAPPGDSVTVSYVPGTLQDTLGQPLAGFTNQPADNVTAGVPFRIAIVGAPAVAIDAGTQVSLSASISGGSGPFTMSWTKNGTVGPPGSRSSAASSLSPCSRSRSKIRSYASAWNGWARALRISMLTPAKLSLHHFATWGRRTEQESALLLGKPHSMHGPALHVRLYRDHGERQTALDPVRLHERQARTA